MFTSALMAATLATRLILAAVFIVAGVAKLRDRAGTKTAVVEFGASERIAAPVALLLPLVELVVAGLLLLPATAAAGAIGALALLAAFSGAIAWNLARGRTPDCHCFGQLHSAPASWNTLIRNGVLAGIAAVALVGTIAEPDASATDWIGGLDGAELLALIVAIGAAALLAIGAFAFLSLMRSYGQVLVRLDRVEVALAEAGIEIGEAEAMPEYGLEPGTNAPPFSVPSLSGETVTLDSILAPGIPALLLFTSPRCVPCKTLLPTAAEWQREHADGFTVAFVSDGTAEEVRAESEEFELAQVLLDPDHELHDAFQANGTPSAVLIAPDGTIGSWVASGSDWIEQLVAGAVGGGEEEQWLPLGAEVPALELATLDGAHMSLADLRGRDSLLLFWNPDCGFCREMHDHLLEWERSANGVTPQLVVVSSGDAESTRAEGFRSRVLLDTEFTAGSVFGANGTPMAVLVDAEGRIASSVAAGADAVLALAGARVHA
jgi:methylamine dehydrogenase accessory protein MauD